MTDPDHFDQNVAAVRDRLEERARRGLEKYGTDTTRADFDASRWLRETQEELLDAAVYIEAVLAQLADERSAIAGILGIRSTSSPAQIRIAAAGAVSKARDLGDELRARRAAACELTADEYLETLRPAALNSPTRDLELDAVGDTIDDSVLWEPPE